MIPFTCIQTILPILLRKISWKKLTCSSPLSFNCCASRSPKAQLNDFGKPCQDLTCLAWTNYRHCLHSLTFKSMYMYILVTYSWEKKVFLQGHLESHVRIWPVLHDFFVSQLRLILPRACIRHFVWINAQCKRIFKQ